LIGFGWWRDVAVDELAGQTTISRAPQGMSLLFDVIVDLPEGIAVVPVFAADKHEALKAAKELFAGHRVTVVLKEGELGS
jgi:hypothetical protein